MKSLVVSRLMFLACIAMASARIARAQETINYASVSGRVTDSQGGVVRGAQVSARQTATNVTSKTATDSEGRFRFPYLKVGPYEITVHSDGFRESTRTLTLTVGAAFDIHTGRTKQAPRWMREHGLEWFFRLCHEPRRLWRRYLVYGPEFILRITADSFLRK